MAAGFRDLLAWILGWPSSHPVWQTPGPYEMAAAASFSAGAEATELFFSGAASAAVRGGNVIIGQCNA